MVLAGARSAVAAVMGVPEADVSVRTPPSRRRLAAAKLLLLVEVIHASLGALAFVGSEVGGRLLAQALQEELAKQDILIDADISLNVELQGAVNTRGSFAQLPASSTKPADDGAGGGAAAGATIGMLMAAVLSCCLLLHRGRLRRAWLAFLGRHEKQLDSRISPSRASLPPTLWNAWQQDVPNTDDPAEEPQPRPWTTAARHVLDLPGVFLESRVSSAEGCTEAPGEVEHASAAHVLPFEAAGDARSTLMEPPPAPPLVGALPRSRRRPSTDTPERAAARPPLLDIPHEADGGQGPASSASLPASPDSPDACSVPIGGLLGAS